MTEAISNLAALLTARFGVAIEVRDHLERS